MIGPHLYFAATHSKTCNLYFYSIEAACCVLLLLAIMYDVTVERIVLIIHLIWVFV